MHPDRTDSTTYRRGLEVVMRDYLNTADPKEVAELASVVRPNTLIYFIPKGLRYEQGQSSISYSGVSYWKAPDWAPDLNLPMRHLAVFMGIEDGQIKIRDGVMLYLPYTGKLEEVQVPLSDYSVPGLFMDLKETLNPEQLHKAVLGTHKVRRVLAADLDEEMNRVLAAFPSERRAAIEGQYQIFIQALERAGSPSPKAIQFSQPDTFFF